MDQSQSQRLKGQVAIVTGSSSGIGKAVVMEMAREGAIIVIEKAQKKF
jgi:glucose 1-dehydrogenase